MSDFTTTIGLSDRDLARGFVAAKKTAKNGMKGIENEVRQSSGRINKTIDGTLKTFITTEAMVRTLRSAATLTREYADQNSYLAGRIAPAEKAIGRFRRSIGRDLAIAAGEGGAGVASLIDDLSGARDAIVNFIADGNRTLFTASDQVGNAQGVADAMDLLSVQDKQIERLKEMDRLKLANKASVASASGNSFQARDLQNQLSLLSQIQELENRRRTANNAALVQGEVATNNAQFDQERSFLEDQAAATQAAIERAREHAEQLFALRDRLLSQTITGDTAGARDTQRNIEAMQARESARGRGAAIGRSGSILGRDQDQAEAAVRAKHAESDRKAAESDRKAAEAAASGLRVRQEQMDIQVLMAQGHEEEALRLRTNLDIRQRTLEIQKQSALTDAQKKDAIEQRTAAARELEAIESGRIAEAKTQAFASAKERIETLRVAALESQGRDAEAKALRQAIRLREFERSIREDASLSEKQKNELVAEGTELIRRQQDQEKRGSSRSLDAGFGELVGQVFGGSRRRPSAAATAAPVVVTHGPGTRGGDVAAAGGDVGSVKIVEKLEEIKVAVEEGLGT